MAGPGEGRDHPRVAPRRGCFTLEKAMRSKPAALRPGRWTPGNFQPHGQS